MTDSILIVGAGLAGLHAAMECANAGAKALVLEREAVVGGKLAAPMTEAGAFGDRAEGIDTPLFEELSSNPNIEIMTLAELESIDGRPGNFTVSIRERARFVTDACTRCKLCRAVCPVVLANEFDAGLTYRKAIHTPLGETLPGAWVIDIENCLNTPPNYLPCNRCVEVCADDAIHFDMPLDKVHQRQVGAVILAPGFEISDGTGFAELGYGSHPDVLMSAELQRLLESPGPTGGYASKPSNEEYPDSVLLVLDSPSQFAVYIAASQVHQLIGQDVGKVVLLVLSQPAADSDYSAAVELAEQTGVQFHWGGMFRVEPTPENTLEVSYEDFSAGRLVKDTYDMVVLCSDVQAPKGLETLANTVGVELAPDGYVATGGKDDAGAATSRAGVFVAGCASGPKNIRASIAQARAAAGAALGQLDPRLLESPPEAGEALAATDPAASQDVTREQIERLLYALAGLGGK